MKKSVVLAVVGLSLASAATSALAQGGIDIGNYRAPFNAVVWGAGGPVGTRVSSTQGVTLTLWYGSAADSLTQSMALSWNTQAEASGYVGYYGPAVASLPGWSSGQTWFFQVRASGDSAFGAVDTANSRSIVWQESGNINSIAGDPPGTPGFSTQSIGLTVVVPEPSSFALLGLGAAGLAIMRRRS